MTETGSVTAVPRLLWAVRTQAFNLGKPRQILSRPRLFL
jgi:hypothetical protein